MYTMYAPFTLHDFMSSNISAPNHVNDVKGGNWVAVNCVVFVVN
jgi:hypothetical protein